MTDEFLDAVKILVLVLILTMLMTVTLAVIRVDHL
jgi:hypothetical protein